MRPRLRNLFHAAVPFVTLMTGLVSLGSPTTHAQVTDSSYLIGLAAELAQLSPQVPPNVERRCGPQSVPWEGLCNVHPDLRGAFLRVEQLPFDHVRDRISAMVRDRHVTVEWEPLESGATHLGSFSLRQRTVWIPRAIAREPTRVIGSILTHELWHATIDVHQLLGPRSQWAPVEYCLEHENGAFVNGLAAYYFFADQDGWPRPRTALDAYLMDLAQDPSDSEALAEEHLQNDGYYERCGR